MARIVIAGAGPLIAFASIDALAVLQKLFSEINITAAVRHECTAKPGTDSQRIEAAIDEGWLVTSAADTITPGFAAEPLSSSLGAGESDSIRFALQSPDKSLLIVDDRLARRFALKRGINIVGTVRILDLAERRGLIKSAELSIAGMIAIGYRVSTELLKQIRSE
jgi:predicted nucleic acid-binding protein